MHITSYITNKELKKLTNEEISTFNNLINTKVSLNKKCIKTGDLDKKINKKSKTIQETQFQVQHRSLGRKIGHGFVGAAVALFLCPLSWAAGTIFFCASAFEGADRSTSKLAINLYVKPVRLCGKLFAKARRSKVQWQASLEKQTNEKALLEGRRLIILDEMMTLNDQLKNQLSKIIDEGNFKIPKLMHESLLLGQRVQPYVI